MSRGHTPSEKREMVDRLGSEGITVRSTLLNHDKFEKMQKEMSMDKIEGIETLFFDTLKIFSQDHIGCVMIILNGGIPRILRVMKSQKVNGEIQEKGFAIINRLKADDYNEKNNVMKRLNELQFSSTIVTAMDLHKTEMKVQIEVLEFMSMVHEDSVFERDFKKLEGVECLVRMMKQISTHECPPLIGLCVLDQFSNKLEYAGLL